MKSMTITVQVRARGVRRLRARMRIYAAAVFLRLLSEDEAVRRIRRAAERVRYEMRIGRRRWQRIKPPRLDEVVA